MIVRTQSATHQGPQGFVVEIEASLQQALPGIVVTGLPGDVVKESRERIRACLNGKGYQLPSSRLVVHLSPATTKKKGSQLDLGIAISLLAVEEMLRCRRALNRCAFLGELCLDGRIRGVSHALALTQALVDSENVDHVIVASENYDEVALLESPKVQAFSSLPEVVKWLEAPVVVVPELPTIAPPALNRTADLWNDVQGQSFAKRAIEIALAGRHHLLLVGPPGVGKSLLARAAADLVPVLSKPELIELVKNQGFYNPMASWHRPFRSPHHSISMQGLIGGGSDGAFESGEVTLAHGGILFLDELPEFRKDALEGLREPLQSGVIHLNRVGWQLTLPADFLLVAAMNPCPCGYVFDSRRACQCAPASAAAYRRKVSGPIYDRIDLCVVLSAPNPAETGRAAPSSEIKARIQRVHALGREPRGPLCLDEGPYALSILCKEWIHGLCEKAYLSFRSLHKTVRVARTIADLAERETIEVGDLQEAWELRCRDFWK